MGVPQLFWGTFSESKDFSILGVYIGVPLLKETTIYAIYLMSNLVDHKFKSFQTLIYTAMP